MDLYIALLSQALYLFTHSLMVAASYHTSNVGFSVLPRDILVWTEDQICSTCWATATHDVYSTQVQIAVCLKVKPASTELWSTIEVFHCVAYFVLLFLCVHISKVRSRRFICNQLNINITRNLQATGPFQPETRVHDLIVEGLIWINNFNGVSICTQVRIVTQQLSAIYSPVNPVKLDDSGAF